MNLDNSCILTAEMDFVRVEQGDEEQKIKTGTRINLNKHWGVLVYKRPQLKAAKTGKHVSCDNYQASENSDFCVNCGGVMLSHRQEESVVDDNRWL